MTNTRLAGGELGRPLLGGEIVGRINQLGAISETPEHLARVFLSPQHRIAGKSVV